jgi:hypothetical protein
VQLVRDPRCDAIIEPSNFLVVDKWVCGNYTALDGVTCLHLAVKLVNVSNTTEGDVDKRNRAQKIIWKR